MSNVYKIIELAGSSEISSDEAIKNAIASSDESLRNLNWFEVKEIRGQIDNGKIAHYQVIIKVGFRLEK